MSVSTPDRNSSAAPLARSGNDLLRSPVRRDIADPVPITRAEAPDLDSLGGAVRQFAQRWPEWLPVAWALPHQVGWRRAASRSARRAQVVPNDGVQGSAAARRSSDLQSQRSSKEGAGTRQQPNCKEQHHEAETAAPFRAFAARYPSGCIYIRLVSLPCCLVWVVVRHCDARPSSRDDARSPLFRHVGDGVSCWPLFFDDG